MYYYYFRRLDGNLTSPTLFVTVLYLMFIILSITDYELDSIFNEQFIINERSIPSVRSMNGSFTQTLSIIQSWIHLSTRSSIQPRSPWNSPLKLRRHTSKTTKHIDPTISVPLCRLSLPLGYSMIVINIIQQVWNMVLSLTTACNFGSNIGTVIIRRDMSR